MLALPLTVSKTEQFFRLLFAAKMPLQARSASQRRVKHGGPDRERQWIFTGTKEAMRAVATQATLFARMNDPKTDTSYYTPNGYYRRDQRLTESLRWLNAFVFDFDTEEELTDLFDRIEAAGLPAPTAAVRTPGGWHLSYFFSQPVRATTKAVRLYTAIMGHMAADLGADLAAIGANRIYRTPDDRTLRHFNPENTYDFEIFKSWREVNHPYEQVRLNGYRIGGNLMVQPAIQYLLHAHCAEGRRDLVCFTLALAMKASAWTEEQASEAIAEWYYSCCDKTTSRPGKKPFSGADAIRKVAYVYKKDKYHAPAAEMVRELSGMLFYYARRKQWDAAKPREERVRSHMTEWKADLLKLLGEEKELTGTQAELAARIGCPLASFKLVLAKLIEEGSAEVETKKGRGGRTVIRSVENEKEGLENASVGEGGSLPSDGHTNALVLLGAAIAEAAAAGEWTEAAPFQPKKKEAPPPDENRTNNSQSP